MVTMAFNPFVSAGGKAEMVLADFANDLVVLTDRNGHEYRCYVDGVSNTPDGEPLIVVTSTDGQREYVFADDVVSVTSVGM